MTRRIGTALAIVALLLTSAMFVGRVAAATTVLNGVIESTEAITPSADAVAVVTLVDQSASPEAGGIIGEQRIDAPGSLPIAFEVLYDDAKIDKTHSYAVVASIVDGDSQWATSVPVPVITGGPAVKCHGAGRARRGPAGIDHGQHQHAGSGRPHR